jgi:hypothetical protein
MATQAPVLLNESANYEQWKGLSATCELRWNNRGALEMIVQGHCSDDIVPVMLRRGDAVVSHAGRIDLFFDFLLMPSYDSTLRTHWTDWIRAHPREVTSIHVASRSKVVSMGVAVANLALKGMINAHTQHSGPYELALRHAGLGVAEPLASGTKA